jgi:hypothetical protein
MKGFSFVFFFLFLSGKPMEESKDTSSKTYSVTLTDDQKTYLMYAGIALAGYFLAKHLVKSAVKDSRHDY